MYVDLLSIPTQLPALIGIEFSVAIKNRLHLNPLLVIALNLVGEGRREGVEDATAPKDKSQPYTTVITAVRCGAVEKTSIILWVEKEDATVAKKMLCHNVPLFAALHVRMVNLESLFKNVTEVREEEGGVRM
jgi:hypothetical protein